MLSKLLSSLVLLIITTQQATAHDTQVGGFIALGHMQTTANNFLGPSNRQHEIVELGLHLNHDFDKRFSFSGQLGYRRFGEAFNDKTIRIDGVKLNSTHWLTNCLGWLPPFAVSVQSAIEKQKWALGAFQIAYRF